MRQTHGGLAVVLLILGIILLFRAFFTNDKH